MAEIKYETLSMSDSTEYEFINSFINYLTLLDSRIECLSDIDTELVDDDHRATFDFKINNKFILRLERDLPNNYTSANYEGNVGYVPILCDIEGNVVTYITGGHESRSYSVRYHNSIYGDTSIGTGGRQDRTWKIMSIIDPDLIGIWIVPYDGTIWAEENKLNCAVMWFVDINGENWSVSRRRTQIFYDDENAPSIIKKCENFAITGEIARMFRYTADVGYIDYLSHVIIKDADDYKMTDTKTLCSSTNVTPGVSYGLASGPFMAIDTNILVKVDTND